MKYLKALMSQTSITFLLLCLLAIFAWDARNARTENQDADTKVRIAWSSGQPRPGEVTRICPDNAPAPNVASSSLNFVMVEDADGVAFTDVEILPGCRIEYTIAGNKTTMVSPRED